MTAFLWNWLLLPLIHWAAVTLVLALVFVFFEAKKLAAQSAERAMHLPVNAKMAEVSFQVTRADGTLEPSQTYRTYRNPFMRWVWALKQLLVTSNYQLVTKFTE